MRTNARLEKLLDAARAPATADELSGENDAVAAFVAHRRRAARAARRPPARTRTAIVALTTGLALLSATGTAVAARTGNLPQEAQQHAHRLFSALGVPAPRTGGPSAPVPSTSPTPAPLVTALSWCDNWHGPKPLSSDNRRKLIVAAGGADGVENYCAAVRKSASATPRASSPGAPAPGSPGASPSASPGASPGTSPAATSPASPGFSSSPPEPAPTSAPGSEGPPADRETGEQWAPPR